MTFFYGFLWDKTGLFGAKPGDFTPFFQSKSVFSMSIFKKIEQNTPIKKHASPMIQLSVIITAETEQIPHISPKINFIFSLSPTGFFLQN